MVARRAVQVVLLFDLEVGDMGEPQVDVHARDDVLGNHHTLFGKAGVLYLLRVVAAAAIGGVRLRGQVRGDGLVLMATRALRMARERRKNALQVKLMAERTVGAKTRLRVDARARIDMQVV